MEVLESVMEVLGDLLGRARHGYLVYRRWYRSKKFKISHLWLFPVTFLWMELVLKAYAGTGIFAHLLYTLIFSLSAGLFFTAVTSFFKKKTNRRISLVILWVSSFYYVVECMMKYTYQVYMSLDSMGSGAGNVLKEYRSELFTAILHGVPRFLIFALPAILYTCTGRRRMPARRFHRNFCGVILAASLILLGIGSLAGRFGRYGDIYKDGMAFDTMAEDFGLFTATRKGFFGGSGDTGFDIGGGESGGDLLPEEGDQLPAEGDPMTEGDGTGTAGAATPDPASYGQNVMSGVDMTALSASSDSNVASISQYVASQTPSSKNAYTGLFKGKNLILLCAEAYSDAVLDPQLTPTLYRLTHNGIYFSEFYQPSWGGSTSTGEFSEIMGIVPVKAVKSMPKTAECNNYFTIGNALQREGYWSFAFHAGNYSVYGRDETHTNLGYGLYLGRGNGLEDINGNDSSDTATLTTTLDYYINNQPFSVYCMTLSGHCIYQKDIKQVRKYYETVKARWGDEYKETTLYYICYQMELENALTQLVAKLDAAGILNDTVICMTSDHYPYGLEKSSTFKTDQNYLADLYGYEFSNSWEKDRNGWILWSGCLETDNKNLACEISTPTYSLDICPTLLNLFGVEFDSRFLVGRDVFSDAEPLVIWNNYSWATDKGKYDAKSNTFYKPDGKTVDTESAEYVDSIKKIVKNKMNYSDQVLQNDYFGKIFGPDEITDNSKWVPKQGAAVIPTTGTVDVNGPTVETNPDGSPATGAVNETNPDGSPVESSAPSGGTTGD